MSHLVVVGFDEIVSDKYITCIEQAIAANSIDGYSVIDLEDQQENVLKRVAQLTLKPHGLYFLPSPTRVASWANIDDIIPVFKQMRKDKEQLKVYIATELKAHESYLRYCVEEGIDCLVEKPIFAPLRNGLFEPDLIMPTMEALLDSAAEKPASHSVMTLSRYHSIYNDLVIASLKQKMLELQAPLTSFHFRTAGGVWNLHHEYEIREDHPYKYGYGMIMHGGYHYIDLSAQFLHLNKLIFPKETFILTVNSFAAYPQDQNDRVSKKISAIFDDNRPEWSGGLTNASIYGETDVTSIFRLSLKESDKTITIGTISLEQTTPSIRTWKDIPENLYNKNGRVSSVNFEAQLSILHSINVECFDIPIQRKRKIERIDAFARVSTRSNASLLDDEEFTSSSTFNGLFHSDSNRKLMLKWLLDEEHRSRLQDHIIPMRMTQLIASSIKKPYQAVSMEIF